jgi:hypothetical protein
MLRDLISALSLTASVSLAQQVELREERLNGRAAWVLDNGIVRIALLRGGGHIAEMRFTGTDPSRCVNPMRVPHYPTIEPYEYDDAKHNRLYGDTPHRWLHSGYTGHLLCFPFYGPPSSEEEIRAGLGNHGEAPIVEWKKGRVEQTPESITFRYGADLVKTQFRVDRAVTLRRGVKHVRVEEWVENLTSWDRPVNWMQHATFGPPFAEPGRTFLDVSATRGKVSGGRPEGRSLAPDVELTWPDGVTPGGKPVSLRPMQAAPNTGTYVALLLDPRRKQQFFTLHHSDYRVLIGYLFPSEGNPWIADWQENRSSRALPWNGETVARGIEWGSTPFAEGLRRSVERGSLFGAPAYRWIGAKQRLGTEYTIFLDDAPENYRGVSDVRMENNQITVVHR